MRAGQLFPAALPATAARPEGEQATPATGILPEELVRSGRGPPYRSAGLASQVCAEGLAGPPLPSPGFAHVRGKALGGPLAGQGQCYSVLLVDRLDGFCLKAPLFPA